jgi:uncharacterized protein involved in exopolysaccharide biosynthesis
VRPETSGIDAVQKMIDALQRRKWLAVGIFLLVVAAAGGYVAWIPKEYAAEMRLYMTRSRVDAPVSAGERPIEAAQPTDLSEVEVNSELELLKSNELVEQAARETGLLSSHGAMASALVMRSIQKNLEVTVVKKTNILSVRFVSPKPEQAQRFVNTIGDLYLEKHSTIHRNRESSEFFTGKSDEYKAQLEQAQHEVAQFEQTHGVAMLEAQREQMMRRRAELEAGLTGTDSELKQAEDRAHVLRAQLSSLPATVNAANRTARNETLIEKLKLIEVELEQKRTELLTKYDPSYRLVTEVEEELKNTRAALNRELAPGVVDSTSTPNPLRRSVEEELLKTETQVAGLRAKKQATAADLAHEIGMQAGLARQAPEYEDLKRKAKIAEENYLLYRRKQEDSRIAEQMDQQRILNVAVLQSATAPVLPMERHRAALLLLMLFGGALLAMVAALVADQMDAPLETALQAVTAAGVPVIANFTRTSSGAWQKGAR